MLFKSNKYFLLYLPGIVLTLVPLLVFGLTVSAQNGLLKKDTSRLSLSPILFSAFKQPVKPNPLLNERLKRPGNQLMNWPNYPLTAAQIAQRDAKYDQPVVKQIVEDVLGTYVNGIINGKSRKPAASLPKF